MTSETWYPQWIQRLMGRDETTEYNRLVIWLDADETDKNGLEVELKVPPYSASFTQARQGIGQWSVCYMVMDSDRFKRTYRQIFDSVKLL